MDGASLTLLENGQYFADWLGGLWPVHPYTTPQSVLPVFDGTNTLLIAGTLGLGDVYTMSSPPPLTVAAQFSPSTILPSGTSLFTLTITNPNPVPVRFSIEDALPPNVFSTGVGLQTTCGLGVLTAPAQSGSFLLANASVGASSSCTVTIEVTSAVPAVTRTRFPPGQSRPRTTRIARPRMPHSSCRRSTHRR